MVDSKGHAETKRESKSAVAWKTDEHPTRHGRLPWNTHPDGLD